MEAVVSRMKTIVNSSPSNATLRFVAVSATVPNVEDVRHMLYSLNVRKANTGYLLDSAGGRMVVNIPKQGDLLQVMIYATYMYMPHIM